jgi:tetratricopeptide (TPR) repeat protein
MSPFCSRCGNSLGSDDRFCGECGAPVEETGSEKTGGSWFDRGFDAEKAGRYDDAVDAYTRAIDTGIEPDAFMSLLNRGILFLNQERYAEAKADLLQYLEVTHADVYPYIYLFLACTALGEKKKGEEYLCQARSLDPAAVDRVLQSRRS